MTFDSHFDEFRPIPSPFALWNSCTVLSVSSMKYVGSLHASAMSINTARKSQSSTPAALAAAAASSVQPQVTITLV
jgi:hypothetical protein